ncbi:MAG: GatB/YqeY domain-containing protein [Dehalococcoidia bacterium]|nr:GatB/YqeY domain-containing protein [Dehalococcoidia bacterium]
MASLKERVRADLADAMRARDETRKSTLRLLLAAVRNAEIPPEGATEPVGPAGLDDAGVLAVVQKQVKQRRDSSEQFRKAGRDDLADKEEAELQVLLQYAPAQAGREEIAAAARALIAETGANGPRDVGKVMPRLTRQFVGRADGRLVNEVVRALLTEGQG